MTGPRQLVLPLPRRELLGREDFYVADSNRAALEAIESWPGWTGGMLALIGPEGAGKTHLAGLHAARSGAALWPAAAGHLIVEDADRVVGDRAREEALFHAFNRAVGQGGSILFTARRPLAGWPVGLPDLRTRLNTVVAVDLTAPEWEYFAARLYLRRLYKRASRNRFYDVAQKYGSYGAGGHVRPDVGARQRLGNAVSRTTAIRGPRRPWGAQAKKRPDAVRL